MKVDFNRCLAKDRVYAELPELALQVDQRQLKLRAAKNHVVASDFLLQ
jgi:hypothetical protein